MRLKLSLVVALFAVLFFGCKDDYVIPKPKAMLRLEYNSPIEKQLDLSKFSFSYNELSKPIVKNQKSIVLDYPSMNGSIFITYKDVDGNLNNLIRDAEKLSMEHMKKADKIEPRTFINEKDRVYGTYFQIIGDAASQSQFYLTDSINHFVTGSVYFYSKPNYDSILPASTYLSSDMRSVMETLRWKE
ncbi:gliding motility lipoprotein GldD [Cellulophaga baltica]|uniref:gliding motility lipoprotein GldD n=1 Tax=Cellulophaga TaxID=104264 RepID=UPI001C068067|nr:MULTISPECIES: gliding motility lipoprotein GldD [Cellulophaga]MBU2995616.1 gliding motility lipoprotein GldD [Cellulophaga baltica]MDO6767010.1 gliding motility lipoprotein GldD [Cellulophaga sp. 1_MG-2023]